jgi:hypothetical protein
MSGIPGPKQALEHQRRAIEHMLRWKRIELNDTRTAIQAQEQEIQTLRTRKARLLAEVDALGHQLDAVNRILQDG